MSNVALVTADPAVINGEDADAAPIIAGLQARGISAQYPRWDDRNVDWSAFDIVIMRSPWDYPERLTEFLEWLAGVEHVTQVLNPPDVIRWNLDKRYLNELAERSVPVVPSNFCQSSDDVAAALRSHDSGEVVIKPTVSVGSRDTGRFSATDSAAFDLAEKILAQGKVVMVQPAIPSVAQIGEQALIYFDGRYSHAFSKGPILELGGGYRGGRYTEVIGTCQPDERTRRVADRANQAIGAAAKDMGFAVTSSAPLYARYDVVAGEDGPALLEAELFEPSYFLRTAPGSCERFVDAVQRRLQLG